MSGARGLRWDIQDLDKLIDRLKENSSTDSENVDWLARLDGQNQDKRRQPREFTSSVTALWGNRLSSTSETIFGTGVLTTFPLLRTPHRRIGANRCFGDWFSVLDDMPLPKWNRGFAIQMRDKAFQQHGRRFANYVIAVGQAVFTWGLERSYIHEHPIKDIEAIIRQQG
jgi:hypothetical protein